MGFKKRAKPRATWKIGLVDGREVEGHGFCNFIDEFLLCKHSSQAAAVYCASKLMKNIKRKVDERMGW